MIGVISPIVDIIASYQAVEALKYLVGAGEERRDSLLTIDLWNNRSFDMKLGAPLHNCPCCQLKQYPAFQENEGETAVSLCGRETVQFTSKGRIDLNIWEDRLKPVVKSSTLNMYLLRVELQEGERLVLFPDGRVLVQGTDDLVRAKVLYARYIGL